MTFISHLLFSAVLIRSSAGPDIWTDPQTHLIWAARDTQAGVSRLQAERFCAAASYGGLHGWRLPTIEELESLTGEPDSNGHRLKAPITVTGWEWSASPGEREGEAWALDFGDGARASVSNGDSGLNRALCVSNVDGRKR
jgi:hypothetical protein